MLEFKEITQAHIDALSVLFAETFNAPPWNESWSAEAAKKRLHQLICVEDFYGICAYSGQELCGLILGSSEQYFDGMTFQIKEFCVKNSLRGKNLGSQLLDEFEFRLKQQGIIRVTLLTVRHNATEGFYSRRGYAPCTDMILMEKHLTV